MSVKAFLSQRQADFISLEELIGRLMQPDGASRSQAATALFRILWQVPDDGITWLRRRSSLCETGADVSERIAAQNALQQTAEDGPIDGDTLPRNKPARSDEYLNDCGFYRLEIENLLNESGIAINLHGEEAPAPAASQALPEWKRILALSPTLSGTEAVCAFLDLDPYGNDCVPDVMYADHSRYKALLQRAIDHGELVTTEVTNELGNKERYIEVASLKTWCDANRIGYPLPSLPAASMPPVAAKPELFAASRWPWGDHNTRALALLADVAKQLWSTYDPTQPDTAPTNLDVVEYVSRKGESKNLAEAIALILRADDLPAGRRKKGSD